MWVQVPVQVQVRVPARVLAQEPERVLVLVREPALEQALAPEPVPARGQVPAPVREPAWTAPLFRWPRRPARAPGALVLRAAAVAAEAAEAAAADGAGAVVVRDATLPAAAPLPLPPAVRVTVSRITKLTSGAPPAEMRRSSMGVGVSSATPVSGTFTTPSPVAFTDSDSAVAGTRGQFTGAGGMDGTTLSRSAAPSTRTRTLAMIRAWLPSAPTTSVCPLRTAAWLAVPAPLAVMPSTAGVGGGGVGGEGCWGWGVGEDAATATSTARLSRVRTGQHDLDVPHGGVRAAHTAGPGPRDSAGRSQDRAGLGDRSRLADYQAEQSRRGE